MYETLILVLGDIQLIFQLENLESLRLFLFKLFVSLVIN